MEEVFQITTKQLIGGLGVIFILHWLITLWLKVRLENSIKHEYEKQIEDYRFSRLKRQKAELVAQLFSKWIKYYGRETDILSNPELINYYEELNRMSMELVLWLDDEKLLKDVMARLQNSDGAKDIREMITEFREFIIEKKNNDFKSSEIIFWPATQKEVERIYGKDHNETS